MENPDFEIAAGWNTDFEKNFTRPETRALASCRRYNYKVSTADTRRGGVRAELFST